MAFDNDLNVIGGIVYGNSYQAGTPSIAAPIAVTDLIPAGTYQCEVDGNRYSVTLPAMSGVADARGKNLFYASWELGLIGATGLDVSSTTTARTTFQPITRWRTHTLSIVHTLPTTGYYIHYYDSSKTWISRTSLAAISTSPFSVTFAPPANAAYIRINTTSAGSLPSLISTTQLEVGSTATTYVPFGTVDSTVADSYDAPSAEHIQRIGIQTMTGAENPDVVTALTTTVRAEYYFTVSQSLTGYYSSFCSHLPYLLNYNSDTEHFYIGSTINKFYLFINKARLSSNDAAGVKAYLASLDSADTPMKIYYKLATPVSSTITPTLLWTAPIYDRDDDDVTNRTSRVSCNASDMQRLEDNSDYLADLFGETISTKTWSNSDLSEQVEFDRIVDNVDQVRSAYYTRDDTPSTPAEINYSYSTWNDVEEIMYDLYNLYSLNTSLAIHAGDGVYAGETIGVI